MKMSHASAIVLVLTLGCASESGTIVNPPESFELTFSDEFEGDAGELPDLSVWSFDLGTGPNGDGWGNSELEYYTGRAENASLDGEGNLRIVAREESSGSRNYTSARLLTQGSFEQQYGRFEARIKLPVGQGIWPAFWMLGDDIGDNGWPVCGEIDIMEFRGQEPNLVAGTIHGPDYSGGDAISAVYSSDAGFDEDFHVFAVEWDPGRIAWFVDDELYHVASVSQIRGRGAEWVFDHPFFLILNLAVGGNYVGSPNTSTPFPAEMLIDYVRVYRRVS